MKAVRCSNGHWFDIETYNKCPHCGEDPVSAANNSQSTSNSGANSQSKKGLFSFLKKEKSEKIEFETKTAPPVHTPSVSQDDVTERFFADRDNDKTVSMFEKPDANDEKTLAFIDAIENTAEHSAINTPENSTINTSADTSADTVEDTSADIDTGISTDTNTDTNAYTSADTNAYTNTNANERELSQPTVHSISEPLSYAVQRISAMEEGKTLSYFNAWQESTDKSEKAETINNSNNVSTASFESNASAANVTSAASIESKASIESNASNTSVAHIEDTVIPAAPVNSAPAVHQTISHAAPRAFNPVVGWLVSISGAHLGESFPIYVGKNSIGRAEGNKIVLAFDKSISREKHATLIYEPKKREFYLECGNTDSLIYINDSFVSGVQRINRDDILEMGSSKFILVPLCGPDFSWEQYM
jgi:hypothetical protein